MKIIQPAPLLMVQPFCDALVDSEAASRKALIREPLTSQTQQSINYQIKTWP
jgi:hypothetical protein